METEIENILNNGNYIVSRYNEGTKALQERMNDTDYNHSITTADDVLTLITKEKVYRMELKDFDWRVLWDKLGNIPVNDNDEIEENFEHFEAGSDRMDVWHWFEWYFNIVLGSEQFK